MTCFNPLGCRFHTRCPYVQPTRCRDEVPALASSCRAHGRVPLGGGDQNRAIQPREREPVFGRGPAGRCRCRRRLAAAEDGASRSSGTTQSSGGGLAQERADEEELVEVAVLVVGEGAPRGGEAGLDLEVGAAAGRHVRSAATRPPATKNARAWPGSAAGTTMQRCDRAQPLQALELAADALERLSRSRSRAASS